MVEATAMSTIFNEMNLSNLTLKWSHLPKQSNTHPLGMVATVTSKSQIKYASSCGGHTSFYAKMVLAKFGV